MLREVTGQKVDLVNMFYLKAKIVMIKYDRFHTKPRNQQW